MDNLKTQKRISVVTKLCPSCGKEFDREHTVCPDDQTMLCPIAVDPLIGKVMQEFEVVERIGEGGTGVVYRAKHVENGQHVAIKLLKCSLISDPTSVKRFQRETEAICSLNHPTIASMFSAGVLDDGRPFLIMEYVSQKTLADLLNEKGRLDQAQASNIFLQIADAMEAAHQASVLHRDIKPGNIMLHEHGGIKVVDFGLAKVMVDEASTTVTRTGAPVGTPAYMSPEQCLGRGVDARSDIYSFGCLMYECLTGKQVFVSDSAFDCMHKHSFEKPKPLWELDRTLPPHMASAVMVCLEKDPQKRFQTIAELRKALKGETSPKARPFQAKQVVMLLCIVALVTTIVALAWSKPETKFPELALTSPVGQEQSVGQDQSVSQEQSVTQDPFAQDQSQRESPDYANPGAFTPVEYLLKQFADVEREIPIVQGSNFEYAKGMKEKLAMYKSLFYDAFKPPPTRSTEVHVVEVSRNSDKPFNVDVNINYTGNSIVLVLHSGDAIHWRLHVAPGVKIDRVILVEQQNQTVTGLDQSVKISKSDETTGSIPTVGDYGGDHLDWLNDWSRANFDSEVVSILWGPGYKPIQVGPENKMWRAQHILWRMRPFYTEWFYNQRSALTLALNCMEYDGSWYNDPYLETMVERASNPIDSSSPSSPWDRPSTGEFPHIGRFTPFAPVKSSLTTLHIPAFAAQRSDVKSTTWYLMLRDSLMKFDSKTGKSVKIKPPDQGHYGCYGITFDTKRNRLLLLARAITRDGHLLPYQNLFAYSPLSDSWSTIYKGNDKIMDGLAYSPSDDAIYTMTFNDGAVRQLNVPETSHLHKLDSQGKILSSVKLSRNPEQAVWHTPVQLDATGKYIVFTFNSNNNYSTTMRKYIIEKSTGRVIASVLGIGEPVFY